MCLKDSYCSGGGGGGLGEAELADANEVMWAAEEKYAPDPSEGSYPNPHLIVGTRDLTEGMLQCVSKTGYADPPVIVDPSEELAAKQEMVEQANLWITCARDAGLTELKDLATPVVDGYDTYPYAIIPLTVDEELLRSVVEACPPYDAASRLDKSLEPWTNPGIGFDAPGYDGFAPKPGRAMPSIDPKTQERARALVNILQPPLVEE
jgi:hypothetical protein